MIRILIFGNSSSGKSTLARELADREHLAHLDLDTLAWLPTSPPKRRPLRDAGADIEHFIEANEGWVIEGCYADLISLAIPASTELFFMDLPVEDCIANAKARPWEPHKYESKEAQDARLPMLIDWISEYNEREGPFSRDAHVALFDGYFGKKTVYTSNHREADPA